jgi:hypothetical protein
VAGVTASLGNKTHQLDRPVSMSIDRWDNMYIADTYNHRVQRWMPGSANGTTVAGRQDGMQGSSLAALHHPFDVVLDGQNGLYIADASNHRVMYWIQGSSSGRIVAGNGESSTTKLSLILKEDTLTNRKHWVEQSTVALPLCIGDRSEHQYSLRV